MNMPEHIPDKVLRLIPVSQAYAWGKKGRDSIVNVLAGVSEQARPGAELWVGAHTKAPSLAQVGRKNVPLNQLIVDFPLETLGRAQSIYKSELPYLFKILSVGTSLSIQAHPSRSQAKVLHAKDPLNYPDSNHKPEVAIAISPLTLLCGFLPVEALRRNFQTVPELGALCDQNSLKKIIEGQDEADTLREALRVIMQASTEELKTQTAKLRKRLAAGGASSSVDRRVLEVSTLYSGGDPGVFCFYVLNLLTLQPGEAVFTGSGVPHAYLEGDLVECMANSDNVIRAGLTPKFIDKQTLLETLCFRSFTPEALSGRQLDRDGVETWDLPADEFAVDRINNKGSGEFLTGNSPQVLFSLDASGRITCTGLVQPFKPGDAFFVPAACPGYSLDISSGHVYRTRVP